MRPLTWARVAERVVRTRPLSADLVSVTDGAVGAVFERVVSHNNCPCSFALGFTLFFTMSCPPKCTFPIFSAWSWIPRPSTFGPSRLPDIFIFLLSCDVCYLPFLSTKTNFFIWLQLELFGIVPLFHQTVKASCVLQSPLFSAELCWPKSDPSRLHPTLLHLVPSHRSTGDMSCFSILERSALCTSSQVRIQR